MALICLTLFGVGVVVPLVEGGDPDLPSRSSRDSDLLIRSSIDCGMVRCLTAVVEVMMISKMSAT